MSTASRILLLTLTTAFIAGCASIDFEYPKAESRALAPAETADTYLGQQMRRLHGAHNVGEAGFYMVDNGVDALAIRLLLADRAERTIDAQYYLIKDDTVGNLFIASLLDAADRGVRVRLLVDDMFTQGLDAGMAAIDSHPNFEIRIFNPFARRSARAVDGVSSFSRINRRMHNKSFTVDNQITLVGGRNIADEYFGARKDVIFGDLDVLGIGPVVRDISDMFDSYWNHPAAIPVPGFARMPDDPASMLSETRDKLKANRVELENSPYAEALRSQILVTVEKDAGAFTWAPYTVAVDSPDKNIKGKAEDAESIRTPLIESLQSAERELLLISAYFVPQKTGIREITELRERGISVAIVTNSLAANNQKLVHGGYAPSRKPLLEAGVRIFEVRADASVSGSEYVAEESARTTLHTKAFVVDRRQLFIGSFNFDPRSAFINTELGVIIDSPKLAEELAALADEVLPTKAWEVFLNEEGKLRWRGLQDGQEQIFKKEPQTSAWERFVAGFYRILPIRGQL
jgi:putative cardiolipin synthase